MKLWSGFKDVRLQIEVVEFLERFEDWIAGGFGRFILIFGV